MANRTYIAIDLKSFYASVECAERSLDPLTTNLVVADTSRTEKTICLAVSPSLKAYGIPGRARLFEVIQKVKEINSKRLEAAPNHKFNGSSVNAGELKQFADLSLSYIAATPRMSLYIKYSTDIYNIYLKYIAPEDIHVYSVDEVLMDVTDYLHTYGLSAKQLAMKMILDVLRKTGITAAAGIGSNLYLCKVAMDIEAKHIPADRNGVRVAELNEMSYRRLLWSHRPLTDFWRIGKGYASRLEENGLYTMGDIARCSIGSQKDFYNENLLYKLFGINAELLIDHAWGWEPCRMQDIKEYKPDSSSLGSGQVLQSPYDFEKARIIVKEMADLLSLDLVDKGMVADQMVMTVGYDTENLKDLKKRADYCGKVTADHYGRPIPKSAHGTVNIGKPTSSARLMIGAAEELYDRITDRNLLIRRVYITANHVINESAAEEKCVHAEQLDLFTDYDLLEKDRKKDQAELGKERNCQKALIEIKKRYGKNAILRGMNFQEGATSRERNQQIGGHKA